MGEDLGSQPGNSTRAKGRHGGYTSGRGHQGSFRHAEESSPEHPLTG